MSFSLFLDGIIVVLLVVTIIYAAILNRRLNSLRRAEGEFADVIAGFNDSAVAAETLLSEVKAVATAGAGSLNRQQLNQQIQAGRGLADDLGYLLQKGEALADQLSSAVTSARAKADHPATIDFPTAVPKVRDGEPGPARASRSRAERELLEALKVAR